MYGFPGNSGGKESACNAGDVGSIPGSGRSPGEGKGSPLQYSCLENPLDRGAWRATVHGVTRVRHDLVTKSPSSMSKKHVMEVNHPHSGNAAKLTDMEFGPYKVKATHVPVTL